MKKKTLLLVIILMSLSLIGLIGFQAYWIHHAVQMEEEVFDRNVSVALHQVARRLETQEAMHFLKEEAPQLRAAALAPMSAMVMEPEVTNTTSVRPKTAKKIALKQPLVTAPVDHDLVVTVPATSLHQANYAVSETTLPKQGRVLVRSTTSPDNSKQHGSFKVFGRSKIDSVIIWKVLAAQATQTDTVRRHARPFASRLRVDSATVYRLATDSNGYKRQADILNMVPARNIQEVHIKGNVVNIFSDSLIKIYSNHDNLLYDSLMRLPKFKNAAATLTTTAATKLALARAKAPVLVQDILVPAPAPVIPTEKSQQQKAKAKAQHLNKVMQQMAVEYVRKEKPLSARLQQLKFNELLANELQTHNIQLPYRFKIKTGNSTLLPNITLASTHATNALLPVTAAENEYLVRLFPNDVMSAPSFLVLEFPNRHYYVWQSLWLPTTISVLFTLIIILTFSFTLYTILRQKKISEIKNDFINNMTHEFKTPIATISLALDALVNPKVRKDEMRVDYYARIIKDENKRMHQQVEKVLQTAQMERQKLQLACEELDVHALIQKAIEPFLLHIEQRQGSLELQLDASCPMVLADSGHLANMIANLLDNANKYSPNAPNIVIQTANVAKGIHISVEDQGAGMSREAQKRVFEKFYRVPTGNVHNVKGFGLGLSYVKTMVEAHAGTIHVRSELGKGSRFTLWLPFQHHA